MEDFFSWELSQISRLLIISNLYRSSGVQLIFQMDLVRESQGSISIFFYDMPIILNGDWKSFENSLFHELLRNLSKLEVAEFFFLLPKLKTFSNLHSPKKLNCNSGNTMLGNKSYLHFIVLIALYSNLLSLFYSCQYSHFFYALNVNNKAKLIVINFKFGSAACKSIT